MRLDELIEILTDLRESGIPGDARVDIGIQPNYPLRMKSAGVVAEMPANPLEGFAPYRIHYTDEEAEGVRNTAAVQRLFPGARPLDREEGLWILPDSTPETGTAEMDCNGFGAKIMVAWEIAEMPEDDSDGIFISAHAEETSVIILAGEGHPHGVNPYGHRAWWGGQD